MLTFYEFPGELRGLVYANNRIESFNKRIKGGAREGDAVRHRGGLGEEARLDVPRLQRGGREKEGEMLEGNSCLSRIEAIEIRKSYGNSLHKIPHALNWEAALSPDEVTAVFSL